MQTIFKPRANQLDIASYGGGFMGITAVPGGGKTHTLSFLAAELILRGALDKNQEILVVTLVNSAVENFAGRVAGFMRERKLLPNVGYRVRTLHSLAHEIVRERPELSGLSENFHILDELAAQRIFQSVCESWVQGHPDALNSYLNPRTEEKDLSYIRRRAWPALVQDVSIALIRQAKDLQMDPAALRERLDLLDAQMPLLEMGYEIYRDYQRALAYHAAVDFDDLVAKALDTLQSDPEYLHRLRDRWPFILEDEAQDSSRLQESLLRTLAGSDGNWVRVGDPNQAIYETFTTAHPGYLRDFLAGEGVIAKELPHSGRSSASIMKLANYLIRWTQLEHPVPDLRDALAPPFIQETPPGDPQPNPPDAPEGIRLIASAYTPAEEMEDVAKSVSAWLKANPDGTLAVLVPTNHLGFEYVRALEGRGVECVELLRSTRATRVTADRLSRVIRHLGSPTSPKELLSAYEVWSEVASNAASSSEHMEKAASLLRGCRRVETYLWPHPDRDWLREIEASDSDQAILDLLLAFRRTARRWHRASSLPIDQLLLIIAHDLFTKPIDLALAHKLAGILRRSSELNPEWRLTDLAQELEVVAKNERRFLGFSAEDLGFDPDRHMGKAIVATVHKAKGLEWDRVYLVSVNSFDFPSGRAQDRYIAEKWFIRDRLDLQAEALGQLETVLRGSDLKPLEEGISTAAARIKYAGERIRLLYVGVTRARRELTLTWNSGRNGDMHQAVPFTALSTFWQGIVDDDAAR